MPIKVTDQSFQSDVLDSRTVMVDFWAEWCGPRRQIAPALEELANEYEGKITVAKISIDGILKCRRKYGVRGIPTLMIFQRTGRRRRSARCPRPRSKNGSTRRSKLARKSETRISDF
jgi:thioredoxin 1